MTDLPRTVVSQQSPRLLHVMLRVGDLERSIAFYAQMFGMNLLRREDYPQGRYTLAFVGYGGENSSTVIELTHNWDTQDYQRGDAYGHIAIEVDDAARICSAPARSGVTIVRQPGPMSHTSPQRHHPEVIAFVLDPDGYRIELIERSRASAE